jgi:hypothetical protein
MKTYTEDISLLNLQEAKRLTESKYKKLLRRVQELERERDAALRLRKLSPERITKINASSHAEATAVVLASDWHIEERVKGKTISHLNEYNLDIAHERAQTFWRTTAKMISMFKRDIPIPNLIVWLGGDFISSNIHEELLETCSLLPVEAAIVAQNMIAGGLQYLLDNTTCNIKCVCSVGNHTRITKQVHVATEAGNSLELFMYHALANHFRNSKRITFELPVGYHSYVDVYGHVLRFHHGHGIKFQGGIGNVFISGFKSIAQWNKGRTAYLDLWGHYHAAKDGGSFVQNGSLIGYNAYALSIKADFETPRQMFFLIDSKRGKTLTCPIIC